MLKTAVLAERFYPDLQWYVDSMLKLIERAGELATKDIWHSTVQLITNYPVLHEYAARKVWWLLNQEFREDFWEPVVLTYTSLTAIQGLLGSHKEERLGLPLLVSTAHVHTGAGGTARRRIA